MVGFAPWAVLRFPTVFHQAVDVPTPQGLPLKVPGSQEVKTCEKTSGCLLKVSLGIFVGGSYSANCCLACWFGAFGGLGFMGSPKMKWIGILRGILRIPNHRAPNQQALALADVHHSNVLRLRHVRNTLPTLLRLKNQAPVSNRILKGGW